MITVLKSVTRIRLVKTENTSVCISEIALYYLQLQAECINTISPIIQPNRHTILTHDNV
jgi:hypothetical protein